LSDTLAARFAELTAASQDRGFDARLTHRVEELLSRVPESNGIRDDELHALLKYVEVELRELTVEFRGVALPEKQTFGEGLVGAMVQARLLVGDPRPEPLMHLVKFLVAARNPPSHNLFASSWTNFAVLVVASNAVLCEMRERVRALPRPIAMDVRIQPEVVGAGGPLTVSAEIQDPHTGLNVVAGTVTAQVTLSDESRLPSLNLNPVETRWSCVTGTSAWPEGVFRVVVTLVGEGGSYVSREPTTGRVRNPRQSPPA
jgi:hypothetical protein